MTPFTIAIPDAALFELEARLGSTRFAPTLAGTGWSYGIEDGFLRGFLTYWAEQYDWRAAETALNSFPQFTEVVDGQTIHFVHARGKGQTNVPILLTNGWPSNFVELLPLVPLLTEAIDGVGFDVIIPSLPGYGFSSQPTAPGMSMSAIAPLWAELMTRLGYDKFLISGSDLGTGVEMTLVRNCPERLIGAHYINAFSGLPRPTDPTPEEQAFLQKADHWTFAEGAYVMLHGTKPATLAVGLNDSPAGLAAWMLEKYQSCSDNGGDVYAAFDRDDLCTILSVYWFSQTIGSSIRLYKEAFADHALMQPMAQHGVPQAIFVPPFDNPVPRAWGERHFQNLVRWTEATRGGHFPALEIPEEMAHDIRAFYGQIA